VTGKKVDCTGLVLAGGQSTRMGVDKSQLCRDQSTMLEFSRGLLTSLGLPVCVSGGPGGIPDRVPQSGPLGGIYSALSTLQTHALLIVPIDMPLLTAPLLRQLLETGRRLGEPVCYEDCYLPFYLPVSATLVDYLERVFSPDSDMPRSVKKLLSALNGRELPVDDRRSLMNANTPEEWRRALALLGAAGGQQ